MKGIKKRSSDLKVTPPSVQSEVNRKTMFLMLLSENHFVDILGIT
jgi:hypothetical protein